LTILTREPDTTAVVSGRSSDGKFIGGGSQPAVRTEKHGVEPGEVSGWVAEETGYSERSATRYLDEKYKAHSTPGRPKDTDTMAVDNFSDYDLVREVVPIVDLSSANGLQRAAKALEREAVLEGVVGGLPDMVKNSINGKTYQLGVAGGGG